MIRSGDDFLIIIDTKPYILRMVTDILYFYSFFLLTNYSKKNKINFVKWSLFIPITFLLQTVSELGNIVPIISGYWLLKEKNVSDNALLSNLIFSALVIYIENILSSTLLLLFFPIHGIKGYGYILVQIIVEFFLMFLFYFLYLKLGVKKFLEENSSTSIVLLLSYLYTVSFLFAYIAHSYDIFDKFIYGIFIFFFIQTIFVLYLILQIMTKQKKKYEQHFIDQELKYLKKYTEQLEKNQEKLAKFRHDYKNLLLSLKGIASINDNFELLNQISHLEKYSVKNLDDIGFEYKFFTNIDNAYLKSLLISKFYQASKKNINCKF